MHHRKLCVATPATLKLLIATTAQFAVNLKVTLKKQTPVLGGSIPVLVMKLKGEERDLVFEKINLSAPTSVKRSIRAVATVAIKRYTFKNNEITVFLYFIFIPNTSI